MTVTLTPRSSAQDCQSRSVVKAGLARLRASARQTRSARLRPERWQHTRGSALLGFVADDAAHVAAHLARMAAATGALNPQP
jgi:hypothetical protein